MQAKRKAPDVVPPIVANGIEYSVPDFAFKAKGMKHNGGYVEAKDLKSGQRIWLKEVFGPKLLSKWFRWLGFEADTQDVFIKSMEIDGNVLKIVDEDGRSYSIALD